MRTRLIYLDGRERVVETECAASIVVHEAYGVERHFAICQVGVYKEVRHPISIRALLGL